MENHDADEIRGRLEILSDRILDNLINDFDSLDTESQVGLLKCLLQYVVPRWGTRPVPSDYGQENNGGDILDALLNGNNN